MALTGNPFAPPISPSVPELNGMVISVVEQVEAFDTVISLYRRDTVGAMRATGQERGADGGWLGKRGLGMESHWPVHLG
jgi:hypothetical protein